MSTFIPEVYRECSVANRFIPEVLCAVKYAFLIVSCDALTGQSTFSCRLDLR